LGRYLVLFKLIEANSLVAKSSINQLLKLLKSTLEPGLPDGMYVFVYQKTNLVYFGRPRIGQFMAI
jgi:hypothetical protein